MTYEELKQTFSMRQHDEGGWYTVIFDNEKGGNIYFLLGPEDFSRVHRVKVDETWHFFEGVPLHLYLFYEDDKVEKIIIDSKSRQHLVPAGCWMAARPSQSGQYSFLGCSVWGKFRLEDVEYAAYDEFVQGYPKNQELIRSLIPLK